MAFRVRLTFELYLCRSKRSASNSAVICYIDPTIAEIFNLGSYLSGECLFANLCCVDAKKPLTPTKQRWEKALSSGFHEINIAREGKHYKAVSLNMWLAIYMVSSVRRCNFQLRDVVQQVEEQLWLDYGCVELSMEN